jgi:uroporphyrinogen III methyltransferase/synthase
MLTILSEIPLMESMDASMITFVDAREDSGKQEGLIDWPRISRKSILVVFLDLEQLPGITERLLRHNWRADTPADVIQCGPITGRRLLAGTIATISETVIKADISGPAFALIGNDVSLWNKRYDALPLSGKSVVITRSRDQAAAFAALLEEQGAEVIPFPTIQIQPPKTWAALDKALSELPQFDWIIFSSAHGVKWFFLRLRQLGGDVRDLRGIRLGAIGPKTAEQLVQRGFKVSAFPEEYRGEALAEAVKPDKGCRVLIARAEEARDVMPKMLEHKGASVTLAPVYRTQKIRSFPRELKKRFADGKIDLISFTSSSTVDGFMQHFTPRRRKKIFEKTRAAAIGPVTAGTLRGYGIKAAIRPPRYTTESLARAIIKHYA